MLPENINDFKYITSYTYDINGNISHFLYYNGFLFDLKFENNLYFFEIYKFFNKFIKVKTFEYMYYKYETNEIDNFVKSLNIKMGDDFTETRNYIIKYVKSNIRKIKIKKVINDIP